MMNVQLINVCLCKLRNNKGMTKQSTLNECYFYVKNVRNNVIVRDCKGVKYLVNEQSFKTCFRYVK